MPTRNEEDLIVAEYLTNGYNVRHAYKAIMKCKDSTAGVNGCRMFQKDRIVKEVRKHFEKLLKQYDEVLDGKILREWEALAFYNTFDIIDREGNLKKGVEKDPFLSCCIEGVVKTPTKFGIKTEIKLVPRHRALKNLADYRQLLVQKIEHTGKVELAPTTFIVDGSPVGD
jgi:hypothetical protein